MGFHMGYRFEELPEPKCLLIQTPTRSYVVGSLPLLTFAVDGGNGHQSAALAFERFCL